MLILTGPPGSGIGQAILEQVRVALGRGATDFRLVAPTTPAAWRLRHQLAREGFLVRPGLLVPLARFIRPWTRNWLEASPASVELLVDQVLRNNPPRECERMAAQGGFRSAVAALIGELSAAGCDSRHLLKALESIRRDAPFAATFLSVFDRVEKELARRRIALESERLKCAADEIRVRGLGRVHQVFFYGFAGLGAPELNLIEAILRHADVTIALPCWDGSSMARTALTGIGFQERRLPPAARVPAVLVKASTPARESQEIARLVAERIQAGWAPGEIAVVAHSREPYEPLLRAALAQAGVPAGFHFTEPLANQPSVRIMAGAVEAMRGGWEHGATLALLKAAAPGHYDLVPAECPPGRGLQALKGLWDDPHLNAILDRLSCLDAWAAGREMPPSWSWRAQALRGLLPTPPVLDRLPHETLAAWRVAAAARDAFAAAMDEAAAALAREPVPFSEFWHAAKIVLERTPFQPPDCEANVVRVIEPCAAAPSQFPVVFLCGLTEAEAAAPQGSDPILPDPARANLRRAGLRLKTPEDRRRQEEFLFDTAAAAATEELVVSYAETGASGDPVLPSRLLDRLGLDADLPARRRVALTPEQENAVQADGHDIWVVGGPGSGKTTLMLERFRRRLEQGASPRRILVLTATAGAALELGRQLAPELPHMSGRALVYAVDGFCESLLRQHPLEVGLDPRFVVLDPDATRTELGAAAGDALEALSQENPGGMSALQSSLGLKELAPALIGAYEAVRVNVRPEPGQPFRPDMDAHAPQRALLWGAIARLDRMYRERKAALNAVDRLGLREFAVRLLRDHEWLRTRVREAYDEVLLDGLDEFTPLEATLVELLRRPGCLFVAGEAAYPGWTLHRLTHNHRSRPTIVHAAEAVAGGSATRPLEAARTVREPEPSVELIVADLESPDDAEALEAACVARRIRELAGNLAVEDRQAGGVRLGRYSDIAVLACEAAAIPAFERALRKAAIPLAPGSAGGVRLMTVEAAAGLEFPIVFLAALHRAVEHEAPPVSFSPSFGLAARWADRPAGRPDGDHAYAGFLEAWRRTQREQSDRLLRAAMCRAGEHLVLSFAGAPAHWAGKVVAGLGLPQTETVQAFLHPVRRRASEEFIVRVTRVRSLEKEIPAATPPPAVLPEPRPRPPADGRHDLAAPVSSIALFASCPWRYYLARYLALENGARAPLREEFEIDDEMPHATELDRRIHEMLAELPVSGASSQALDLAARFQLSALGRRVSCASRIQRESEFLLAIEGLVLHGRIDLWFEEDGQLVLVDYKADEVDLAGAERRAQAYAVQLRLYALGLERLAGRLPDQALVYMLRPDLAVPIDLSPGSLAAARECVRAFRHAQEQMRFPPLPGEHCRACGYDRLRCAPD